MTSEEKALIYFKDLRARKVKDYSSVFDTAPKDSVVYEAVSAEIEIYDTTIKALEQTRWIPVSERLPEEDGEYLLYGKVVDENEDNHKFIGLYDEGSEGFGWWQNYYDNRTLGFLDSDFTEYASVLAWMPLPESYKAESEE